MATQIRYLNVDLAKVYEQQKGKKVLHVFAWGDAIRVRKESADVVEIEFDGKPAYIRKRKGDDDLFVDRNDNGVLKIDFVDVQQGDGSIIETPKGKVVLVDGGDNQLFARYLAARYSGSTEKKPKKIDCIVVTHGDADHFAGLTKIHKSESLSGRKRLFIHPQRVYHNGLVKRPEKKNGKKRKDEEMLGATRTVDGQLYITGLENDIRRVSDDEMNEPFREWKEALLDWKKRHGNFEVRRLEAGMHEAFDFLRDEDIDVQVVGPLTHTVGRKPALRFLGDPPKGPRLGHESLSLEESGFGGKSASHTINGHSIIFRLTYGQFNLLFTGDLNDEAGRVLTREHNRGTINLRAEVFKVPHHGSADFSGAFVQAVSPAISVISSGDESTRKEYIHPRATIMGTLGRYSRVEEPLIFVTELVAFFSLVGSVAREAKAARDDGGTGSERPLIAFERASFGIVKIRTDGQRLLVFTHSGKREMKEAYAYTMDDYGKPSPAPVRAV